MFREMRRKERKLDTDDAKEILTLGEYGVLCLKGDYPYGVPVSYVYINDVVYIHCAIKGLKTELMEQCSQVCFTVVKDARTIPDQFSMDYTSAILFGKASLADGEEKREALLQLCKKYSAGFMDQAPAEIEKYFDKTAVIKITVEHISGKQSAH